MLRAEAVDDGASEEHVELIGWYGGDTRERLLLDQARLPAIAESHHHGARIERMVRVDMLRTQRHEPATVKLPVRRRRIDQTGAMPVLIIGSAAGRVEIVERS